MSNIHRILNSGSCNTVKIIISKNHQQVSFLLNVELSLSAFLVNHKSCNFLKKKKKDHTRKWLFNLHRRAKKKIKRTDAINNPV